MINTFEDACNYIEETPKFTKKHSLEHTRECLRRLGNPGKSFRVIHVAGTNGKGSTCAFLFSVLKKAGYRCGLFTSPHLTDIRERFIISESEELTQQEKMVSKEEFLEVFNMVKRLGDKLEWEGKGHPTYFEMLFLMGMLIFKRHDMQIVVLETGLGGRLDATTAADSPLACVITSISIDHTQYLGSTIPEIAYEKAGIIVPGVPVIYCDENTEASEVIRKKAAESGSLAIPVSMSDICVTKKGMEGIDFYLKNGYYVNDIYHISFAAEYQVMNAALAVRTIGTLAKAEHLYVTDSQLAEGIASAAWPGRMEMIIPGVFIDGAHNEDGIRKFIQTAMHFQENHRLYLLFSAVNDKNYPEMIREICSSLKLEYVAATEVGGQRRVSADKLAELFRKAGCMNADAFENPSEALEAAMERKSNDGCLFCVGSLYLAGIIRPELIVITRREVMCKHDRL